MYKNPPDFTHPSAVSVWMKHLIGVDINIPNGYCFVGDFVGPTKRYSWNIGDFAMQSRRYFSGYNSSSLTDIRVSQYDGTSWYQCYEELGIPSEKWARGIQSDIAHITGHATQDPAILNKGPRPVAKVFPPLPEIKQDTTLEDFMDNLERGLVSDPKPILNKCLTVFSTEELVEELLKRDISPEELESLLGGGK